MTAAELIELRARMGKTQAQMARAIGLSLRSYQDIEGSADAIRLRHQLAIERVTLSEAVALGDLMIALPAVRRDAIAFERLLTGRESREGSMTHF